jgi:hypothetical protein
MQAAGRAGKAPIRRHRQESGKVGQLHKLR